MISPAITARPPGHFAALLVCGVIAGFAFSCVAANLVAHWTLKEPNGPYLDSSGNHAALFQDDATTPAISGVGIDGAAAQLNFQNPPGISTRLFATNAAMLSDSFGFSFWINPSYLNPSDNFIAREMPYSTSVSGDKRLSWQVRMAATNILGSAPVEFIIRGNDPSKGTFFGNVFSATNLPLFTTMSSWIHVAGGYDSMSGALVLFVDGVESVSSNSIPGAHSSGDSPFDIGTVKNGPDFVAFSAGTYIDDVQLYNGPLSVSDVAFLMANPGQDIRPFVINSMTYDSTSGSIIASVASTIEPDLLYTVKASTNLHNFTSVTNVMPSGGSTTIILPQSTLDDVFGPQPRSSLFLKIKSTTSFTGCE